MIILKKNGTVEEFDINKVKIGIANSAYDIGITITEADLNMLLKEIVMKVNKFICNSHVISSCELRKIIYQVLKDCGFAKIAKSYLDMGT